MYTNYMQRCLVVKWLYLYIDMWHEIHYHKLKNKDHDIYNIQFQNRGL